MKLRKLFLYVSFIFVIFLSITNVNATENVKIKSIDLVDKSVNASETSESTFDGLTMNFNLRFLSVDDYAKYKVVVENKESSDYKISVDSEFNNSKYITYEYEKTDRLKANSESEFYVTVTYKNKVSDSDLVNDKYTEKNSAVLKLSNGNVSNPKTSNNEVMIIIGLVVMMGVLLILFKNKKTRKISVFVLLELFSVPLFVKAVDYLKITFNSNVSIEKGYSVGYEVSGYIKVSEFDDYDLTHARYSNTIYIGSADEENKHIWCNDAIYKGKKLYAPGSIVNIKDTDLPGGYYNYISITSECECFDGSSIYDCDDTKKIVCNSAEKESSKFEMGDYIYSLDDNKSYGYKANDDDNTVMKFLNALDDWESEKIIGISMDTSFTMPSHDVLFTGGDA